MGRTKEQAAGAAATEMTRESLLNEINRTLERNMAVTMNAERSGREAIFKVLQHIEDELRAVRKAQSDELKKIEQRTRKLEEDVSEIKKTMRDKGLTGRR